MNSLSSIIDFRTRVFPAVLENQSLIRPFSNQLRLLKRQGKFWTKPLSRTLHSVRTISRHLPGPARILAEELQYWALFPNLAFESTSEDLLVSMKKNSVERTLLVPHAPYASSELILDIAKENPEWFFPSVQILPQSLDGKTPTELLEHYHQQGARALWIDRTQEKSPPSDSFYYDLLNLAGEMGIPVLLQSGDEHTHITSDSHPSIDAREFEPWFRTHPATQFVLARMNLHRPLIAINLAEEYPHVWVDTAWQPAEMIGEAVRRLGSEKVLFASDWPWGGSNLEIGIRRLENAVQSSLLSEAQAREISYTNALRLLGEKRSLADAPLS